MNKILTAYVTRYGATADNSLMNNESMIEILNQKKIIQEDIFERLAN